jgi:hypothetical protein
MRNKLTMMLLVLVTFLMTAPAWAQSYPVTDSFSGSGALSSNWTNTTSYQGLSYPPVPLVKSSGPVVPNTAVSWGLALYTGASITNDQYAQVTFVTHNSAGGWTGPCVRTNVGAYGYCYLVDDGAIVLFYDGQWYQTLTSSCPVPSSGDTVQISAIGTTITCTDVTKGTHASATDSTYWVGSLPGVMVDTRNYSAYALTSFQADCVPTCSLGTVATPTFSPAAGSYSSAQTVTISDSTSGATIHYTTDGSTPTASSTTYTAPITVSVSETVMAIAIKTGYTNSAVGSAVYTINLTVATPTLSPGTGSYSSAQTVTISDSTSGATIHYTTDGSTPTASSTTYSSPITVSTSETVNAIGVLSGYTNSGVGSAIYTISGSGHTWYVRPDGGTRYSSNVAGQCNGMYDAPYPGSGTNQNCAFNDVRMLYQDGSYTYGTTFPGWGWVGAGGDTYIIRGSIGTGVSYRIGCEVGSNYAWCIAGSPPASGMPSPLSGTATQHTRILGENYASCHSASAKTQLHGGQAVGDVLGLSGSSYVDVACLDITDFASCGKGTVSNGCDTTQDFAQNGIQFSNTSTNDTLTDIHIHGMATHGIFGPTGGGVVLSYVDILGNAVAGWDADDGTTGVGSLLVQNFNISWNGCAEEYPTVDPLPYRNCYDDTTGGYGDGFGTGTLNSPAPGWQVHFDQGTVSYNTQDGLDALHIGGPGSTMTDTRVLAFGNMGNQLKVGGATATIQNSVIVGNCYAMTFAIPGTPSGYNSGLADFCRPSGTETAVAIDITPGDPGVFQDNTIYEGGKIGIDVEYATGDVGSTNTLKYNNNVFVGFFDTGDGENPTPIYSNTDLNMLTNPGASWTNNSYFGYRSGWTCPAPGESAALCISPNLTDMTYHAYGYGNMAPASASSDVVGAGVTVTGLTTDYKGATRANPPTIGACETTATCP